MPLIYDELRKLAAQKLAYERAGQTLQPTALVHEAYLRSVGDDPSRPWDGRAHFFAAAAEAMRRILIDQTPAIMPPAEAAAEAVMPPRSGSTSTSMRT